MTDTLEAVISGRTIPSSGGANVFMRTWLPTIQPRGIIVIIPGFNAHGGQYEWVAEQLNAGSLIVHAVDLRGRGKSEGERFYVEGFDDYVDDVAAVVAQARLLEPALPIFLLGHSAGGVIACFFALLHPTEVAGLICESFAFELPAPGFALSALRGLSHILPHAHVVRLKNEDFSRDPEVVRSMNEDPLISGEKQPAQTIAEMARADQRLSGVFSEIKLPVLILHGTADKAAKPSGSQHFYNAAGSADKTLKLYEGYFHDLLHDTGKERVMSDINDWIGLRLTSR